MINLEEIKLSREKKKLLKRRDQLDKQLSRLVEENNELRMRLADLSSIESRLKKDQT